MKGGSMDSPSDEVMAYTDTSKQERWTKIIPPVKFQIFNKALPVAAHS